MTDAAAYSLVAGISVGFAAGYVGSLMVLKRMALVGDALSHVALPGLALGILFNFNPFFGAFAFLFSAAALTWYIEKTTKLFPESIIGVLFVTALAVGILLTPQVDLLEALFGDITTVSLVDALLAVGVSVPIVVVARLVYRRVVLGILSEEPARSTGVNVALVNFVYLFLVTLVVAVGIKIVGTVLVGALVVVPAAAMKNVSRNLSSYALLSGLTGTASAGSGILLANYLGLPAAGSGMLASPRVTTNAPSRIIAPPATVYALSASWRNTNERIAATTTSKRIRMPEIVGEIVRMLATYNMSGVKVGTRPRYAMPSQPLALVGRGHPTKNRGMAARTAVVERIPAASAT